MTEQAQKELGKTLWNIADTLRGAMNADDFRDYMLSFLFLRYLSDNYEAAAKKELGKVYPDPNAIGNGGKTSLSVWYAENKKYSADFEKQMRRKVHYVVKPDYLWGNSSTSPRRRTGTCWTLCRRGSSSSRKDRSPATIRGCSRRST